MDLYISDKQQECDLPLYGGSSTGEGLQATPLKTPEDLAVTPTSGPETPVTPTSPSVDTQTTSAELKEPKLSESCKYQLFNQAMSPINDEAKIAIKCQK